MVVVDASVLIAACLSRSGFAGTEWEPIIAPPLAFSETVSVLHEHKWRGDISAADADAALRALGSAPVRPRPVDPAAAWAIADELGLAKTYDCEYVALAREEGCPLLTLDERLRRGAGHLVTIRAPTIP